MRSTDPDFEAKATDDVGLCLAPPQHAVVFCVEEKTAIQARDRIYPLLPLSPGRAERQGFDYYGHGTLSLYAALNTHTGRVLGSAVPRYTSDAFVALLQSVADTQPRRREIHIVVVDNLSDHKTRDALEALRRSTRPAASPRSWPCRSPPSSARRPTWQSWCGAVIPRVAEAGRSAHARVGRQQRRRQAFFRNGAFTLTMQTLIIAVLRAVNAPGCGDYLASAAEATDAREALFFVSIAGAPRGLERLAQSVVVAPQPVVLSPQRLALWAFCALAKRVDRMALRRRIGRPWIRHGEVMPDPRKSTSTEFWICGSARRVERPEPANQIPKELLSS